MAIQSDSAEDDTSFIKGAVAGAVAGVTAAWVMENVQTKVIPKVTEAVKQARKAADPGSDRDAVGARGGQATQQMVRREEARGQREEEEKSQEEEQSAPATVKAANAVTENLTGDELPDAKKETAGRVAHYAMGTVTGTIYGIAAEYDRRATMGAGLPFGATVWAVADEFMVPALGLSKPPQEHPPSTHAYALASHLAYGFTAEMVRRAVRKAL